MCYNRSTLRRLLEFFVVAGVGASALLCSGERDSSRQVLGKGPVENRQAAEAVEPIPFPDGVTDSGMQSAYVSSPKGGIQAIRLKDGKVLWTNDACRAQPWLVAGSRLVARGEGLFILDLKNDGKLLRQCEALPYPKVAIPERCTVAFHLWGPRIIANTLEANWYALASIDRSKGRPFAFQAWMAFNKSAPVGTLKVDLDTGRVVLQANPKPADITAGLMPAAAQTEKQVPAGLPAKLAAVWQQYQKDENGRITILGKRLVGVSMKLVPVGAQYLKKIVLNAWDVKTGTAADSVELVTDKAINIANIVLTEDRHHAGVVFGTSAVAIFSLADGKRVGIELKGVHSPERAVVDGKRLYYAQLTGGPAEQMGNFLKAIDVDTGKVAWERALKPRSMVPLPP
jgi:hypothetical protein